MPLADRDPLRAAEARVCELERQLDAAKRECVVVERDRRYWASQTLRLKRSNMLLSAAFSAKSGAVAPIKSHAMWQKEAAILELMLQRWAIGDRVELIARVLYRAHGADGKRLFHAFPALFQRPEAKPGTYLYEFSQALYEARDIQTAAHFRAVFTPEKAEAMRVCTRWSWNKVRWVRDTWKWNWAAVDGDGEPIKERVMIAPGSKVPMPEPFPIKEMQRVKHETVHSENISHSDGRGAECRDLDALLLRLVEQVQQMKLAGGFSTMGTEEDPHWIVLTGDGAGLTDDDSGVRIVALPGTTELLNQSTNLVHNLCMWRASSLAEHWDTVLLRMAHVRPALMRIWQSGQLKGADGSGSGVHVRFALSGDKPFMCHVLGRRNFSHDYFSPHCKCCSTLKQLYEYGYDKINHYTGITFEERCSLALITVTEAMGLDDDTEWTITSAGKVRSTAPLQLAPARAPSRARRPPA